MKVNNPKILQAIKQSGIRVNRRAIREANKPTSEQLKKTEKFLDFVASSFFSYQVERFLGFLPTGIGKSTADCPASLTADIRRLK